MTGARDIELRFGSDGVLRVNVDGVCELRSRLAAGCMLRIVQGNGYEFSYLVMNDGNLFRGPTKGDAA